MTAQTARLESIREEQKMKREIISTVTRDMLMIEHDVEWEDNCYAIINETADAIQALEAEANEILKQL